MLFISIISMQALAQSFRSPAERRLFADHLFCKGDYLRASEEYRGCAADNDIFYRLALCYLRMDEQETADKTARSITDTARYSDFIRQSFKKLFLEKKYSAFYQRYEELETIVPPGNSAKAMQRYLAPLLYSAKFFNDDPAPEEWFSNNYSSKLYIDKLKDFVKRREDAKYNPWVAGGLSALVPGLGKIYTRRYSDGITAFILTGLFAYVTSENIRNDHPTRAWITGAVAAFFYGGAVYGSYVSAHLSTRAELDLLKIEFSSFLAENDYFIPAGTENPCK